MRRGVKKATCRGPPLGTDSTNRMRGDGTLREDKTPCGETAGNGWSRIKGRDPPLRGRTGFTVNKIQDLERGRNKAFGRL